MKFKVGDRVRMKNIEVGTSGIHGIAFSHNMSAGINLTTIVTRVHIYDRLISTDLYDLGDYWYHEDWFELASKWERICI